MGKHEIALAKIMAAFHEPERVMAETARAFAQLDEARYATPGTPENRAYHLKLRQIDAVAAQIKAKRAGR